MLRTILVLAITAVGFLYTFQAPIYGLLLYLWMAYFRPEDWVSESAFVISLKLSYIAAACLIGMTVLSRPRWRMNVRVLLLALFLAHGLVSVVLGAYFDYAFSYWIEFLKTAAICYLIVVLVTDVASFRLVLLVVALSLGLEAAKQGWIEIMLHPGAPNVNTSPLLGDNNGVALGMLMLIPILTTLAATAKSRYERLFFWFLTFGILYRGIVTYSRGGFLACAALGLYYVLRSRNRMAAVVGIVVAMLVIVPVLPDTFWQRMNTISTPDQVSDESALGRLHFWKVAVAMSADHPVFGVGYNSFNPSYDRYDDLNGLYGRGRSVHSSWFGVLAELGYPGLLLLLAQLVLAFRACARARAAARLDANHAQLRQFAFAIEASLIVFVVAGTFLPSQYSEMLWHFIALSISLDVIGRDVLAKARTAHTPEPWMQASSPRPMLEAAS